MTAASNDPPHSSANQQKSLQLLWAAFLVAIVLYAPIPWLIVSAGADSVAAPPPGVRSGLRFAALGAGASSFVAKRWWTNSLVAALRSTHAAGAAADVWARLRAGCMVVWALSEAVALIGLASALIAQRPLEAVPMTAAAVLLLYLHRPASWPLPALERGGQPP
jgi:hypothetical protein